MRCFLAFLIFSTLGAFDQLLQENMVKIDREKARENVNVLASQNFDDLWNDTTKNYLISLYQQPKKSAKALNILNSIRIRLNNEQQLIHTKSFDTTFRLVPYILVVGLFVHGMEMYCFNKSSSVPVGILALTIIASLYMSALYLDKLEMVERTIINQKNSIDTFRHSLSRACYCIEDQKPLMQESYSFQSSLKS